MKGSKIWGVGKHHLYINGQPRWVYVSPEAIKKDYQILKANLPIPIGIDHLSKEILQQNKILGKMNLLDVGVINDVELTNEGIHILEAKITHPSIQELYDTEQLPDFSMVGNVSLNKCKTGQADYVENYNVISRVDFVEKGACTTCNVDYSEKLISAKSVIGDMMAEENKNKNEGDGQTEEPTLNDVMKGITDLKEEQKNQFDGLDERIKVLEENKATAGETPDPDNDNPEDNPENPKIDALEAKIADLEAKAAIKEATSLVNGYIDEGKVLPKDVEDHVGLALAEPEKYTKLLAKAPVVVEIDKRHSHVTAGEPEDDDPEKYSDEDFEKDYEAAYGKEV